MNSNVFCLLICVTESQLIKPAPLNFLVGWFHWLNMDLDLQSLFGLHVT
jgi:hypothetical protein